MFSEGSQQPDWQDYEHVDTVACCVKDLICGITGHQGSLEVGVEFTCLILISAKLFWALVKHPLDLWPKGLSSSLKSPGFIAIGDYPARITHFPVHLLISNIGLRGGRFFFFSAMEFSRLPREPPLPRPLQGASAWRSWRRQLSHGQLAEVGRGLRGMSHYIMWEEVGAYLSYEGGSGKRPTEAGRALAM